MPADHALGRQILLRLYDGDPRKVAETDGPALRLESVADLDAVGFSAAKQHVAQLQGSRTQVDIHLGTLHDI